jgi:hypothetical protein
MLLKACFKRRDTIGVLIVFGGRGSGVTDLRRLTNIVRGTSKGFLGLHGRPRFAKHSIHGGEKVKIAPVQ